MAYELAQPGGSCRFADPRALGELAKSGCALLAAMRPAIAILIPAAVAGTVVLFAVRQRRPKIHSTEALLPDLEAN